MTNTELMLSSARALLQHVEDQLEQTRTTLEGLDRTEAALTAVLVAAERVAEATHRLKTLDKR